MKVITAPESHENNVDVFLAGGISNCPLWQDEVLEKLSNTDYKIYNPRREGNLNPAQAVEQIEWEYKALHNVKNIIFWFPKETLCPITLYELGVFSHNKNVNLFVGVHPGYQRKVDVFTQLRLAGRSLILHDNINSLLRDFQTNTIK